jgi:hypothetical protein
MANACCSDTGKECLSISAQAKPFADSFLKLQFTFVQHRIGRSSPSVRPKLVTVRFCPVDATRGRHAGAFRQNIRGSKVLLRPEMRFSYYEAFEVPSPDVYETLLWDVTNNHPNLLMRADEAAWQILMPALEAWRKARPRNLPAYAFGSWAPKAVRRLPTRDEHDRKSTG